MLENLASFCFRRRWLVLAAWLIGAAALTIGAGSFGGEFATNGRLRGTDSDAAYQLFAKEFGQAPSESAAVVFRRDAGLRPIRAEIDAFLRAARDIAGVESASFAQTSADGRTGLGEVEFADDEAAIVEATERLRTLARPLEAAGTQVEFASDWFVEGGVPATELLGIGAAAVILLIAFGSVVAMGLPIVTAVVGLLASVAAVGLITNAFETPEFTVQVASMVGLGVGIDYALFIVTRFRTALAEDRAPIDAAREAMGTAGRAVVLAGGTVMISLLGMFLMGLPFLYGLAVGTAAAVLVAVVAAITLLPALLGIAGTNIDRLSIHRRARLRRKRERESPWHRWSRTVQARPVAFAAGGLAALLLAAAPVLSMRLATADDGSDPASSTTRKAYDLIADGFGPGTNGPLLVVVAAPWSQVNSVEYAIRRTEGVAAVDRPVPAPSGRASLIRVTPTSGPQDRQTVDLVHRLRNDVLATSGVRAHVGGPTASDVDFASKMAARLPVFIGAVLALSFVLLLAVFRSVLVPLKAVVMNLLSIGAAYGVMVAVFQWGRLGSLVGIDGGAPIEPWAPMMLFAIVFGLSMDYEVFLLSSVKERYDRTGDNSGAVVDGLAATARVITAAAAIMVCVFGSFVLGEARDLKLIGFGLAAAVLLDATVVRLVLVPATMELLGARNWWMPRWLSRVAPQVSVGESA